MVNHLTRGSLVVTSTNMCMYPNFETVFIPRHKPETLLRLTERNGTQSRDMRRIDVRVTFVIFSHISKDMMK